MAIKAEQQQPILFQCHFCCHKNVFMFFVFLLSTLFCLGAEH